MSGLIGRSTTSGIVGQVGGGIYSYGMWYKNIGNFGGGDVSGFALHSGTEAEYKQAGPQWTHSGAEFSPPLPGYWEVGFYVTFYESGNTENDNCEGQVYRYDLGNSNWTATMVIRVGHQYDGSYRRGFGFNKRVMHFPDTTSGHKIKATMGTGQSDQATDCYFEFLYKGM